MVCTQKRRLPLFVVLFALLAAPAFAQEFKVVRPEPGLDDIEEIALGFEKVAKRFKINDTVDVFINVGGHVVRLRDVDSVTAESGVVVIEKNTDVWAVNALDVLMVTSASYFELPEKGAKQ